MKKLFLIELKHCMDSIGCKMIFLILSVSNLTAYIMSVVAYRGQNYQFIRSFNESFFLQSTDSTFILYLLESLLPILSIIIWSLSKRSDEENNRAVLLVQRVGIKKYLSSKTLATFVVTFTVTVIPFLINLLLCFFTFPLEGYDSAWAEPDYLIGIYSYYQDYYIDMVRLEYPTIYNMIYIFNWGIFSAGLALLGLGISFLKNTEHLYFIKIPIAVFIIYTLQNAFFSMLGLQRFTIQSYLIPNSFGNIFGFLCIFIILYLISAVCIKRGMKRYELL